jgi:hypothetical protein
MLAHSRIADVPGAHAYALTCIITGNSFFDSSPAVANGAVYIGSLDLDVYAFSLPESMAATHRPTLRQLHPNYTLRLQHGQPA